MLDAMLKDPIARRYFVMNFFDGVMTAFGIVVGGALAIKEPIALFKAGLGASLAIMVSGFFGAYMTEMAERKRELKEMEKLLLRRLDNSLLEKEAREKMIELAIIDGVSPFIGAILPILPFLVAHFGVISPKTAIFSSLFLTLILLLYLGSYLGKLMGESPLKHALFFTLGGVVVGLIAVAFEKLF